MINKVLEAIKKRRSIRKFSDKPISKEKINQILEAARWTPSGKNNQPWRFLVIENEDKKIKLAECTHYSSTINLKFS